MKSICFIFVAISVLILFHELGHIITAKIMKLKILGYGFRLFPYPCFYVSVNNPDEKFKRMIFLFSGSSITLCSFVIAWSFDFFGFSFLYWAYFCQIAMEVNPFFSDFTVAYITNNEKNCTEIELNYRKLHSNYRFSKVWFIHFIIWICLVLVLLYCKSFI
jgi:hypothetical protein